MKNGFINKFRSTYKIKITGKNVERFLRRLMSMNIELLDIKYPKYNEAIVKIYKVDYPKLEKIKTIYEMNIIDSSGLIKIKKQLSLNKYFIFFLILGYFLLLFLTNLIFEIEVVHNDKELRELITTELETKGLKKYNIKKNYKQIQKIKKEIIEKYKDKIEWIEIEENGTKYIVRVEERILNEKEETYEKQDIVAKKSAILLKVDAKSGEIVRNKGDYVHEGDVVITGNIKLYDETKDIVSARGKIYGEVWYNVTVEYPLEYKEETLTNNKKNVFAIKIFNKTIELFNFDKYKDKKIEEEVILKHNLLPFKLVKQKQSELNVINETYTKEEAIEKAILAAKEKIESKLNDNEYIISTKQLHVEQNNSKIIVELFFTVCEDITDIREIEEITEETKENTE